MKDKPKGTIIFGKPITEKPLLASLQAQDVTSSFLTNSTVEFFPQFINMITFVLKDDLTPYEQMIVRHLWYTNQLNVKEMSEATTILSSKLMNLYEKGNVKLMRLAHACERIV